MPVTGTKILIFIMFFYSSELKTFNFLKQQIAQLQSFSPNKIAFKDFYQGFACLIYDARKKEYFLIRDHFGFEPFYYIIIDETKQLCFGSTMPDVLAHITNPELDQQQVENVLTDICASSMAYTEKTFHKNVWRVTPGNILQLQFLPQLKLQRHTYWNLAAGSSFIHYPSDDDYDAHFTSLLEEACTICCKQAPDSLALEFSGGLDTSAILTALDRIGISAQLFMHIGEVQDECRYGEQLLKELHTNYPIRYIDADDFDVIAVLDQCKQWFAGGAPYLFFMFAANIHQAVQLHGSKILLSGFGGDECVSSHAPLRTWGAEVKFNSLLQALNSTTRTSSHVKQLVQALKLSYPYLYYRIQRIKSYRSALAYKQAPIHYKPYKSLQEREADWLTGNLSYHVRMRIEYSAIVAKNRGFSYQYPLLYPPLVEFCFSLPPEQKRRLGQNRLLMRRYLDRKLPSGLFNQHQKCGDILPGTMPKCQALYKKGLLNDSLTDLPYQEIYDYMIKNKLITSDRLFHLDLLRYMFK